MLSWIATPGGTSVHVDLMQAQVPDATTLAKMRHSLEKAGITARGGSMVDATFTWALKLNEEQRPYARPLKRTSPRKGGTWRIGYKAHIGVDAGSGLVHGVETTA
jgi:IS5 family transposase